MLTQDPPTHRNDVHLTVEDTVFSQTESRSAVRGGGSTASVTDTRTELDTAVLTTSLLTTMAGGPLAALAAGPGLAESVEPDILLAEDKTLTATLPCRVQDAELWFADTPAELEQAKAFCAECPVRQTCLAGALSRREPWGVWGGEIFERGAVIARKRPRGRPRKDSRDVAA